MTKQLKYNTVTPQLREILFWLMGEKSSILFDWLVEPL